MITRRPGTGSNRRIGFRGIGGTLAPFSVGAAAARLPTVGIGVSTMGLTLADTNTTVDQWAATLGGQIALMGPLIAPASTDRPAYNATGGAGSRPLVTFNGVEDHLIKSAVTKGSVWTGCEMGVVGTLLVSGSTNDLMISQGAAAGARRWLAESATAGRMKVTMDNAADTLVAANSTTVETTTGHWSVDWTVGADANIRVAGAIEGAIANDRVSYADGAPQTIGGRTGGAGANVAIQAWYYSTRQLTAAERTYLRALLTFHTGVAC